MPPPPAITYEETAMPRDLIIFTICLTLLIIAVKV